MKRAVLSLLCAAGVFAFHLPGVPLHAAATIVSQLAAGSAAGTDVTVTLNTVGADGIAAWVTYYDNSVLPTFDDNQGNSYSCLADTDDSSGSSSPGGVWCYKANPTTNASHALTVHGVGSFTRPCLAVYALAGMHATPFDQDNQNVDPPAASIQPNSITPTDANEIVLTGVVALDVNVSSINGGFTIRGGMNVAFSAGNHVACAAADLIQTTATAANPTWTLSGTSAVNVAAAIASFFSAPVGTEMSRRRLFDGGLLQ